MKCLFQALEAASFMFIRQVFAYFYQNNTENSLLPLADKYYFVTLGSTFGNFSFSYFLDISTISSL